MGFFCNLAVRPVAERFFMSEEELATERALLHGAPGAPERCINYTRAEY